MAASASVALKNRQDIIAEGDARNDGSTHFEGRSIACSPTYGNSYVSRHGGSGNFDVNLNSTPQINGISNSSAN